MLGTIIKKEVALHVLTAKFAVVLVLFFGLILMSIFVLGNSYKKATDAYRASLASHNEEINKLKAKESPNEIFSDLFWRQGIYSDRQPQELGIFARGLDKDLPETVHMAQWYSKKINKQFYNNPVFNLFTTPDFIYIVNIILSLLAILFTFDAICGEKEAQTLKLVLSNPVPRNIVILGKWIGGYLTLMIPFILAVCSALAYISLTGLIPLTGENVSRILMLVVISSLYISVFFTLGIFISTLTHHSNTALLISLFIWVIWVLIIPNLSPVIGGIISPTVSIQKINAEKALVDKEAHIKKRRINKTMISYGKDAEKLKERIDMDAKTRKSKLDNFYNNKLNRQLAATKLISRISPSASFTYSVTELAGTGIGEYKSFNQAYKRMKGEFGDYYKKSQKLRRANKLKKGWFKPEELPKLRMVLPRLNESINTALFDILLLLIFNIIFFMSSYMLFLRYDAR